MSPEGLKKYTFADGWVRPEHSPASPSTQTLSTDLGRLLNRNIPPRISTATKWRIELTALESSGRKDTVLAQKLRHGLEKVVHTGVQGLRKDSEIWGAFREWFMNPQAAEPEGTKKKRSQQARKRRSYFTYVT